MKQGIIGNCQYNALVNPNGNVDWLCWPRFDSSFILGSLLDQEKGGVFQISPPEASEGAQIYLENTNILRTRFTSEAGCFDVIDFAPRFQGDSSFFRPKTLIRILRPVKGHALASIKCQLTYDYGRKALTQDIKSNRIDFHGAPSPVQLYTSCPLDLINKDQVLPVTRSFYFVLHWGYAFDFNLREYCELHLSRTTEYWQRWVKHCHLPSSYQKEVIRSALTLKLHQYEDTGAIIAATTTSIPESHLSGRTWDYRYCWLRDTYFTLAALRRLGQFEEMEAFVSYLLGIAEQSNGHLQPVYGIGGETNLTETTLPHLKGYRDNQPIRIGNQAYEHLQHDIYGEMIISISPLFLDARIIMRPDNLPKSLLLRLLSHIEQFLEAEDAGLWEYRGIAQVHTFSVLMHWAGARHALKIAEKLQDALLTDLAKSIITRSETFLRERCWNEEILAYTQASGSAETDASLLQMVSLGFLKKEDPKAHMHVATIQNKLGTKSGLLRRYVHADDFGMTSSTFTICTFWLAETYARLGEKEKAKNIFENLLRFANHLNLYSEDIDPATFEQWGNFPQTYSHVGLINAAFTLSEPWE